MASYTQGRKAGHTPTFASESERRTVISKLASAPMVETHKEISMTAVGRGEYFRRRKERNFEQGYELRVNCQGKEEINYVVTIFLGNKLEVKGFDVEGWQFGIGGKRKTVQLKERSPWGPFNPFLGDSYTEGKVHCDKEHKQSIEWRDRVTAKGTRQWMYCRQEKEVREGIETHLERIIQASSLPPIREPVEIDQSPGKRWRI